MINKVLIVNRGEIAVRIIKACREMKILSAVIYSDPDIDSLHVRAADEAYRIGPAQASESYLHIPKIIELAKEINADAIHPGYGFLSENAAFIRAVEDAGITFIGPGSDAVLLMGQKTAARTLMKSSGVPIVPGTTEPVRTVDAAIKAAEVIGYPVMIKASAGGGGKGMRKVFNPQELPDAFEKASSEARKAFGNDAVYIERFIVNPKHIEVQIIADKFGNYLHLFERECSVQRRHQKVIEEAPSIAVDDATREKITSAAILAAKACNYVNAGTIEFLMDRDKKFYFLEMNTRLQVEHPVTEMITGIDLVKEQIKIASGEELSFTQEDVTKTGHAVECRVYAEDVDNNFAPSTGKIIHHRMPSGPGIRIDRGIDLQTNISVYYDPMLSKVIAWGKDREEAIVRLKRALSEYQIAGVITNIHSLRWILTNEKFIDGSFDINFIENEFLPLVPEKWKQGNSDELKFWVSVLGALLKHDETKLKANPVNCTSTNKWTSLRYE
ncbi:MAG: acetyl-CoA carboxylase biotin carboxylase subunit [Melioribacteraceae bacterium]|nr:MAG: acetyl-CoA carboxylase biotin carboxylase subunit [Melioribacteraceae bacterium]